MEKTQAVILHFGLSVLLCGLGLSQGLLPARPACTTELHPSSGALVLSGRFLSQWPVTPVSADGKPCGVMELPVCDNAESALLTLSILL